MKLKKNERKVVKTTWKRSRKSNIPVSKRHVWNKLGEEIIKAIIEKRAELKESSVHSERPQSSKQD